MNSARISRSTNSAPPLIASCSTCAPFLFAPLERPSFPLRAAGDDHRPKASFESASGVGPVDAIEAHLHQVGAGGRVTRAAQLLHRPSGDRYAEAWGQILFLARVSYDVDVVRSGHSCKEQDLTPRTKKPPQLGLGGSKSVARGGSRASRQPPRRRTTTSTDWCTRCGWPRKFCVKTIVTITKGRERCQ